MIGPYCHTIVLDWQVDRTSVPGPTVHRLGSRVSESGGICLFHGISLRASSDTLWQQTHRERQERDRQGGCRAREGHRLHTDGQTDLMGGTGCVTGMPRDNFSVAVRGVFGEKIE